MAKETLSKAGDYDSTDRTKRRQMMISSHAMEKHVNI